MEHLSTDIDVLFEDTHRSYDTGYLSLDSTDDAHRVHLVDAEALASATADSIKDTQKVLTDHEQATLFTKLNRTMNGKSAKPPTFEEAQRHLKLDVQTDLPENDPISGQKFSIKYKGLPLKPWQAQAIDWMPQMLDSPMRAAILGDDVGLGKTVSAYCSIIETAYRLDQKIIAWDGKCFATTSAYWQI